MIERDSVRPLLWIIALALLLHAPALDWGFFADDHGLMCVLERGPGASATLRPWSLFDFGTLQEPGSIARTEGFLPWWTDVDWKVRFFRPLASLSHAADWAVYGRAALGHHATSLAVYALLLVLLHALYRAAGLSRQVALWALAIFACEDGSVVTVGWLANRNALLEAVFSVAAALVALRAPRPLSQLRVAGVLTLALLACGAKESGVSALLLVAYLFARERNRVAASIAALIALGYVAALLCAGYGTHSVFYLMPWHAPFEYAARVGAMTVLGTLSACGPFPVDVPVFFPALFVPWFTVALALGALVVRSAARVARDLPSATFFALWGALTLLPQAGASPSDRLLFVPMIGAAPFLALLAVRAFERGLAWRRRLLPIAVALAALPLSAFALLARGVQFRELVTKVNSAAESAEVPRDGTRCDALVLQSGSTLSMLAPDPVWIFRTGADRVRFHPLQVGRRALRLHALDEHTLEIEALDEAFLTQPFEAVFRSSADVPAPGTRYAARGFTVEVLATNELGPSALRLVFERPFAEPSWRLLTWRAGAFRRIDAPAVGAALDLPRAEPLDPLMP